MILLVLIVLTVLFSVILCVFTQYYSVLYCVCLHSTIQCYIVCVLGMHLKSMEMNSRWKEVDSSLNIASSSAKVKKDPSEDDTDMTEKSINTLRQKAHQHKVNLSDEQAKIHAENKATHLQPSHHQDHPHATHHSQIHHQHHSQAHHSQGHHSQGHHSQSYS